MDHGSGSRMPTFRFKPFPVESKPKKFSFALFKSSVSKGGYTYEKTGPSVEANWDHSPNGFKVGFGVDLISVSGETPSGHSGGFGIGVGGQFGMVHDPTAKRVAITGGFRKFSGTVHVSEDAMESFSKHLASSMDPNG